MAISEWVEKLGRAIFESPFGAQGAASDAPELAEVRLAVLDEVKSKSHRVAGRRVFPYNVVRILLRGVPDSRNTIFTGPFFAQFCEQEIRAGLARLSCHYPDDLRVEVETTPDLPGPREQWLTVEAVSRANPSIAQPQRRTARLVVVRGSANHAELPLSKARVNIGRTVEVYRAAGPSRRNDLAFHDPSDVNATVSREHAHIMYSKKTGEYRLFNDRFYQTGAKPDENCGLWIIRDGLSRPVHRDARGVRLQSGDEIHLGRAVVRFVTR
jgi:hypothetical protein